MLIDHQPATKILVWEFYANICRKRRNSEPSIQIQSFVQVIKKNNKKQNKTRFAPFCFYTELVNIKKSNNYDS